MESSAIQNDINNTSVISKKPSLTCLSADVSRHTLRLDCHSRPQSGKFNQNNNNNSISRPQSGLAYTQDDDKFNYIDNDNDNRKHDKNKNKEKIFDNFNLSNSNLKNPLSNKHKHANVHRINKILNKRNINHKQKLDRDVKDTLNKTSINLLIVSQNSAVFRPNSYLKNKYKNQDSFDNFNLSRMSTMNSS